MTTAAAFLPPVMMMTKPGISLHAHSVGDVLAQLGRAITVGEQLAALARLANVADRRALPAIRIALASDDVRVREAAVEALRPIDDRSVPGLLEALIMYDPAPTVRCAAIFIATIRCLPHVVRALQIATSDPDEDVRVAAGALLGMP